MNTHYDLRDSVTSTAFQTFLANTSDILFVKDHNLVYTAVSMPFVRMAGKTSPDEIIGRTDFEIFENQELAKRYTADDYRLFSGRKDLIGYIEPLTDERGHPRYSSTSKYILTNDNHEIIGVLGISRDITQQYLAQQRHLQELKYLFELPNDTYAALFMDIDSWRVIRHRSHTTGPHILPLQETMQKFSENAANCLADPNDTETLAFYRNLSKESMLELCGNGNRHHALEYLRRMPNGETVWVRADINFLVDPESGHLCAIWSLRNIDSIKQAARNLQRAAERDEMTGLLNRTFTRKYIQQALEENPSALHALFILDVDHFKTLNDTYGHQTGDDFLIALSNALKNCFRESDIVGRIGGDEFFILMKNVPNALTVTEKAETVMNISKMVCDSYQIDGLSVCIGISLFPMDGITLDNLYAKADAALYQAKRRGKNQFFFANHQFSYL